MRNPFSLILPCMMIFALLAAVGCGKSNLESEKKEPKISESFRQQFAAFLVTAGKLNEMSSSGFNKDELISQAADEKSKFEVLDAMWPTGLKDSVKEDLKQATRGWSLAAHASNVEFRGNHGQIEGEPYHAVTDRNVLYNELVQYSESNPFSIHLKVHEGKEGTKLYGFKLFFMAPTEPEWERFGITPDFNCLPKLLTIASAYFDRSKPQAMEMLKP